MTNKVNGCSYIGYSEDIEWRSDENRRQLREGTFGVKHSRLAKDYQIFGEQSFSYGILEVTSKDQDIMSKQAEAWKDFIKPEYNRSTNQKEFD